MKKVRDEMGLTNVKLMIPFCRTVEEGRRVQAEMAKHGLKRGENGLELYVMCEIPSNVILAEEFAEIFDGFSIGSNDLTQLILGVDRDSEIVAPHLRRAEPGGEDDDCQVIAACRAKGRKIGICGQAPSDYPEFAQFLVERHRQHLAQSGHGAQDHTRDIWRRRAPCHESRSRNGFLRKCQSGGHDGCRVGQSLGRYAGCSPCAR